MLPMPLCVLWDCAACVAVPVLLDGEDGASWGRKAWLLLIGVAFGLVLCLIWLLWGLPEDVRN